MSTQPIFNALHGGFKSQCYLHDTIPKKWCPETGLLNPEIFRKEAVRCGMTMLDVDNNPSTDTGAHQEDMVSKGDACYESAWIDKLLGDSDPEDEDHGADVVDNVRRPSHRDSCHQDNTRQDSVQFGIFCFA